MTELTAAEFAAGLTPGMRMRDLFDSAKRAADLPLSQVTTLFAHPAYEVRMGACCILDFRAKSKRIEELERRRLYEVYLDHHDAIDTWDMVDRSAPSVVGGYLLGRPKTVLHDLATSHDPIRRRTAITAPLWFIRFGSAEDLAAVFDLATGLARDPDPVVHTAVGIAPKHAGARDPAGVIAILDEHGQDMPRVTVRLAADKLGAADRARFIAGRASRG